MNFFYSQVLFIYMIISKLFTSLSVLKYQLNISFRFAQFFILKQQKIVLPLTFVFKVRIQLDFSSNL